jgi:dTDP-glucose 4,6-dehydratase
MKILITGAAGFIGSEFLHQLATSADSKIVVVDSLTYAGRMQNIENAIEEFEFKRLDIRDKENLDTLFRNSSFDKVVHFAAESHVDNSILNPSVFLETNILGTQNLLEMSIKYDVFEFLHVSTDEVYGSLNVGFATEDHPFNPSSAYSASKAAAEHFVNAARHTYNLNTKIVRCSNNYGPRQYPEKLIPFFVSRLIQGKNLPIYGTGKNIREWLHVSDCASAIISVLESQKTNEIFNVSSGQFYTNLEVAMKILETFGYGEDRIDYIEDRKGHDFRYALNSQKISEKLGWKPQIDFDSGLARTIEWYRSNLWALAKE